MIHYFSQMKVDDWEKRRSRLEKMIDDGAMIYQVFGEKDPIGMELYNKQEFIDKLTVPSGSLRNIEILDSRFKEDKICVLRFRINEQGK
jgi:cyclopropane fatty-acyl-phospholipid synthase-like methyltransferase